MFIGAFLLKILAGAIILCQYTKSVYEQLREAYLNTGSMSKMHRICY